MTHLEQQVREALTDAVLDRLAIWYLEPRDREGCRGDIVSALRPLLEQQAAAVATLTAKMDEAREITKRMWNIDRDDMDVTTAAQWAEDYKKIAAWSGETR